MPGIEIQIAWTVFSYFLESQPRQFAARQLASIMYAMETDLPRQGKGIDLIVA
jgi:hypothetical protein